MSKEQEDEKGIRIQMMISKKICPELHAQLAAIPSRHRSERLRLLATVGLLTLQGEMQQANPEREKRQSTPTQEKPGAAERITKMLGERS
ncbi:MAG: hypothetical protein JXR29_06210 [Methylothermaceae bacterium]|nr:hypothetical protein [Methylothermaceae bacterium]